MAYSLGIDLGTTYSAAATLDDGDVKPSMVGLGNRALQIPSAIYLRDDDSVVVGEQAEHLGMSDPTRVAREFKRRLGDPVRMIVGGRSHTPQFFMTELLRWILDHTVERRGQPPSRVTLTHPASWTSDFKVRLLREAAENAQLPDFLTISEPVAAALNYAANNPVELSDSICVYDLGGGTFDVCLLKRTPDGFDVVGTPGGDPEVGGINFDKSIIAKFQRDHASLFVPGDPDDPGLFRFQRDCVEAKEALSVDVDTVIPLTLGGLTTRMRLTRPEFESIIDSDLNLTIEQTRQQLTRAGLDASDVRSFVLVGGSSRIPLVTEKLVTAFGTARIARNTHPKHEVALGAALAGRMLATGAPTGLQPATFRANSTAANSGTANRRPSISLPPIIHRAGRGTQSRLLKLSVAGISAAVVVGGVIIGTQVLMGTAQAQKSDAAAITATSATAHHVAGDQSASAARSVGPQQTTTSAPFTTPTALPGGSPATGESGDTHSGAPSREASTGVSSSELPAAPSTFDPLTVLWFQTLCSGGSELLQHDLRSGQSYRSLTDAQAAFVYSFMQRADIAASTATALQALGSAPVADGNMDAAGTIQGLRALATSLRSDAQTLQSLSPQTSSDLSIAAKQLNERTAADHQPADLGLLARAEREFVQSLPGCSS